VIREARELSPDVVVISGDLTQRARKYQYLQARNFLHRLPAPQLVIPGNHDVPLYNIFLRFLQPLGRYRAWMSASPNVAIPNGLPGLALVGLDSTRSFTIDGGKLRAGQLAWAKAQFSQAAAGACRIVAVHHHFLTDGSHQATIRRADYLLGRFAGMGVEIVLTGHRHWARAERAECGPLIVQAGTATSRRGKKVEKGENSFNLVTVDQKTIRVTSHRYQADRDRFEPVWEKEFSRSNQTHTNPA